MAQIKEALVVLIIAVTLTFGIITNTWTTIVLFWIAIFGLWSISTNYTRNNELM